MINMIFARYAKYIIIPTAFSDFWVYYTNKKPRHVNSLSHGEMLFLGEAARSNRIIKTHAGVIYQAPIKRSPDETEHSETEKRYIGGYHQTKKKGKNYGKKKAALKTGRNKL